MNGLERRLRNVRGVADITIELGETGLDGIRVRIDDDTDEGEVLENIRRILVAYGLRSKRADDDNPLPAESEDDLPAPSDVPRVTVRPGDGGLTVEIVGENLTVVETGDRNPIGSAEAMVRAVARLRGSDHPERLSIVLDDLDGVRVITMLGRRRGRTVVSAAVCDPSLVDGLYEAADSLIVALESESDPA